MIRSVARHTPFFKALTVFCLILLFRAHTVVEKTRIFDGPRYLFKVDAFLWTVLLCTLIPLCVFLFFKAKTKIFWIDNDNIDIKFYLKKRICFSLSEIALISWGSNDKTFTSWSPRNRSASARNDSVTITFKDGFVLSFDVSEYTNFDELRAWLLNYGKDKGIVKVKPVKERGSNKKQKSR